jgi:hypothetical protein
LWGILHLKEEGMTRGGEDKMTGGRDGKRRGGQDDRRKGWQDDRRTRCAWDVLLSSCHLVAYAIAGDIALCGR